MPRNRPDACEAAPCKPEPKRPPYQADRPAMPPIPARCHRCNGLVVTAYEETRCLSCGWYLQPLPLPQQPTMKSGPQLPKVVEVGR